MIQHLPVLVVLVPLLAAPLAVIAHHRTVAWGLFLVAALAVAAASARLLVQVLTGGPVSYAIGGWAPPWGIEYRIDLFSALLMVVVGVTAAVVAVYARRSAGREVAEDRLYLFYAAMLLFLAGLMGVVVTGDAFNLFVFIEISSLSSYALIALGRDRRALLASYRYLVLGTVGATFYLIGVGLLYQLTGTLNMADLAARLVAVEEARSAVLAFTFISVGVGLKLALFPLHVWLPNAYTYAPSVVSTFVAATATKVFVYVLLRFTFTIFGPQFAIDRMYLNEMVLPLALAGVLFGSALAITQRNAKRLLAYSSVAQVGYMALGASFVSVPGLTGGIAHIANHALAKGALFMALGAVAWRTGSTLIDELAGIGRRMPWTMAALVVAGLSLIGVPGTAGFVTKWYLVSAALEQGRWAVVAGVLLSSLLAVVYVWRLVEAAWFAAPPEGGAARGEAPLSMLVPLWALAAANVYFGFDTRLTAGLAARVAHGFLGSGG